MKKILLLLMVLVIGACSVDKTDSGDKPETPKTFLDIIPGEYVLEDKNVKIGADGDIYEGDTLLYSYEEETSTASSRAYYSLPEGGFVGLKKIVYVPNRIELYKKDRIGSWDSKEEVLFTPEHVVATETELFKIKIQTITKFYNKDIDVNVDGNFTVMGTDYSFKSLKNDSQAIYMVGTDLYVGIAIVNDTIKMYQENKTTPWTTESAVLFDPLHEFAGFPEELFKIKLQTITKFYNKDIDVNVDGNFTVMGTDYSFKSLKNDSQAVYTVGANLYVGIAIVNDTIKMYQENKTTPWTEESKVLFAPEHEFVGYMEWQSLGGTVSAGTVDYLSLAMDSTGVPYVAYNDSDNGDKVTVKKYDGTTWVAVGGVVSTGKVYHFKLAINSTDEPYLAYRDYNNRDKATVKKYNGTTWVAVGGVVSTKQIHFISLVIDSTDVPYVAYRDRDNDDKVTVKKYNGTTWVAVGGAASTTGLDSFSLAIGKNDEPYLASRTAFLPSERNKTTVKKYDGTTWVVVGGVQNTAADPFSLVMDKDGVPYLAYRNSANSPAMVKKYDGTTWAAVGGAVSTGVAFDLKLAMDSDGMPYVVYTVYTDYNNSYKAMVKKYNGTTWVAVGGVVGSSGVYNLAIDSTGVPYLAYDGEDDNGKATVKKYDVAR